MRYNYPGLLDFTFEKQGECSVRLTVHFQADVIRAKKGSDAVKFTAKDKTLVGSWDFLEMAGDYVALEGRQGDRGAANRLLGTSGARDTYYDKILVAIEEFAASHGVALASPFPRQEQLTLWD